MFYSTKSKTIIKFKNRSQHFNSSRNKKIWKLYDGVFVFLRIKNEFQNRNLVENIYNAEIERTRRGKKENASITSYSILSIGKDCCNSSSKSLSLCRGNNRDRIATYITGLTEKKEK